MTDLAPAPVPAARPDPSGAVPTTWRSEAQHVVRTTWAGLVAGLLAGLAFGGIGGRIAMRIVTLQSDPRFDGILTDDQARVGEITLGGTALLVSITTFAGVVAALAYLVVRPALPAPVRTRAAIFAVVSGVVGGSQVVRSHGVDFTLLGQRWVSVAMFVGLLVGHGAAVAVLAERFLAPDGLAWRVRRPALALAFVALIPFLAFVPVAVVIAALATARRRGLVGRVPPAIPVWAVRAVLVVGTAAAAYQLTSTLVELAELA